MTIHFGSAQKKVRHIGTYHDIKYRSQGRPRRGKNDVGREELLLKLRGAFRAGVGTNAQRKVLAEMAEVSPALITYYFPTRPVMLKEIAQPVVMSYLNRLEAIACESSAQDAKMKSMIQLLLEMYSKDIAMLDLYEEAMRLSNSESESVLYHIPSIFKSSLDCTDRCSVSSLDIAMLQGAIWGICRFASPPKDEPLGKYPLNELYRSVATG